MAWTGRYDEAEPQRVNKWLGQSGVCSRREAEALIEKGLVSIDGETVTDTGRKILPGQTLVLSDGGGPAALSVVLHKPMGIVSAHIFSVMTHTHLELGTYVLFAVLCGAASYIAVPAVQRLAIPEASPTLPLAASLGLTFSYNVTIGIPVYIEVAKAIQQIWPA